jgi:hypothetical protein
LATGREDVANRRKIFPTVYENLTSVRETIATVGGKISIVGRFSQPRAENFSIVEKKFAAVREKFATAHAFPWSPAV